MKTQKRIMNVWSADGEPFVGFLIAVGLLLTVALPADAQGWRSRNSKVQNRSRSVVGPTSPAIVSGSAVPSLTYRSFSTGNNNIYMSYPNQPWGGNVGQSIANGHTPNSIGGFQPPTTYYQQDPWVTPLGSNLVGPRSASFAGFPSSYGSDNPTRSPGITTVSPGGSTAYRSAASPTNDSKVRTTGRTRFAESSTTAGRPQQLLTPMTEEEFDGEPTFFPPTPTVSTSLPRGFTVSRTLPLNSPSTGRAMASSRTTAQCCEPERMTLGPPPVRGVSAQYPVGGIDPEYTFSSARRTPPGLGWQIYDQHFNSQDPTLVDLGSRQQFQIFFGQRIGLIPPGP